MAELERLEQISNLVGVPVEELKQVRANFISYKEHQFFKVRAGKLYTKFGTCSDWIFFGLL